MPSTYTPIATTTLASNAASYTFSSIPATYTDLVLVVYAGSSAGGGDNLYARLNGDTGTNYSTTEMNGYSSSARAARTTNATVAHLSYYVGWTSGITNPFICNFMNYANTTTFKTLITRAGNTTGTEALVSLWRNTSAINSILLFSSSGNLLTGSTLTLYGIKAA